MTNEVDRFEQYGFPYPDNLIMSFLGGSAAHGAKLPESADTDWYGVFIEPPEKVLGLDKMEHFVTTTGDKFSGNKPTDVDICLYSLRKWANLAAVGNPSSLYFLFAPQNLTAEWDEVRWSKQLFLSAGHVKPFLGFANAQMARLFGEKGQKNVKRAELEEKYGYDTKYAMHVIRLYGEAKELMEAGHITLPRPNKDELIAIRQGKYTLSEIRQMGNDLEVDALKAANDSPLPPRVNREKISELISRIYLDFWQYKRYSYNR